MSCKGNEYSPDPILDSYMRGKDVCRERYV